MLLPRHNYRSPEVSQEEARLTHEMQSSSAEVNTVIELLQNSNPDLQKLQDAITAGRNAHASNAKPEELNFTDKIAANLQSKNNPETTKNLQTLLERIKTEENLGGLSSAIAMVQQKLDSQSPTAPDVQAGQTPEKIETEAPKAFKTKIADTAETISNSILPTSWTDKLSRPQKIAAGTIMTFGAGVLLWQLGKMLWNRGKKSADEGKEASEKSKGGFFKKLLIGGGITLAAFFGLRYFFKKSMDDIENRIKKNLPDLPSAENITPYLNAAEAASGASAGMISKVTERITKNPAIEDIHTGIVELGQANTNLEAIGIAAKHGAILIWHQGGWVLDNGIEAIKVPYQTSVKLLSGNFKDPWEGGWLYGEAGAAYILGKGSITSLITGKIRLPLTMRAVGATATRMAAFPVIAVTDAGHIIKMMATEDGRMIAGNAIKQWGPLGFLRDRIANKNALKGTEELMEQSMQYFRYQRKLLATMKAQMEGQGFKGLVREGSVNAIDTASQKLAKNILAGAVRIKEQILAKGGTVPGWVEHLAQKSGLSDINGIISEVDAAGNILEQTKMASAAEKIKDTLKTAADFVADGTRNTPAKTVNESVDLFTKSGVAEIKGKNVVNTTKTAEDVVTTASTTAKAVDVAETTAEGIKTFDQLHDAINAAKAAKDNKKLIELLKNPILLQSAREGNKTAKALLRVQRLLTFGKWAGRALIVIGTLIDAAMIGVNEWEIAEAKKEGNIAKQQILEAKRQTLVVSGGAGLGTLALTGPAALLAVPVAVSSIYANSIYDSVIQWEKHSSEWMNETPEELKNKLDNLRYGALDEGKRVAVGHSLLYRGWRWGTSWTSASKEKNNEEDEEQHRRLENINSLMRQEILAAYFLKTMKVSHLPNESDNEFVKRTATLVRDRMNYIRQITEGTYDASLFGERVFEYAGNYAELMSMRRILETQGKTLQMNYEYNGKNKVLNLEDMSYVFGGEAHKNVSHQTFSRTLYQYEQEVKIQQEAVQDLYSMEDIPETK